MKKENDEITDLFRTRLTDAEISVRDGFWEELSQNIPAACQHRRRILLFRVATAASVLLVLAASSATFLYFSPKEEMEEAFKIAVANGGQMDGDGIRVNQLPLPVESVLPKPAPKSFGMLSQRVEEEDSLAISFSMSFSFSSAVTAGSRYANRRRNVFWQAANGNGESVAVQEDASASSVVSGKETNKRRWAVKARLGTALPADDGAYKMPVSAGVTVERKLNDYLGIETGLLYSNLRSAGQQLHYLGIPVRMNVLLLEAKKVDLYATVGGIADKCIAGAPDNCFKEEPVQLAVTAGIGLNYKINDRLELFAEPGISHHFGTDSKLATVRTKRPTNFNLLCGLRMTY
ncbi:outer membrane beta-barrel protein [uncultured Bacteroides sp.]|uniref:outer membrane beta-barrel protein n=1 Tax=uncultured Bacteroides sp. TaxID=162156 RepID=UPI0025DE8A37|nr:outer membrane beta-barrel protein [uncultured Bacteroides sp.]